MWQTNIPGSRWFGARQGQSACQSHLEVSVQRGLCSVKKKEKYSAIVGSCGFLDSLETSCSHRHPSNCYLHRRGSFCKLRSISTSKSCFLHHFVTVTSCSDLESLDSFFLCSSLNHTITRSHNNQPSKTSVTSAFASWTFSANPPKRTCRFQRFFVV